MTQPHRSARSFQRLSLHLGAAFLVLLAGCAEDSDEGGDDEVAGTESGMEPGTSAGASGGGNASAGASGGDSGECVDGRECFCPDGMPSIELCVPEPTCFCGGDPGGGGSGGMESECGISVPLSGAFDGSFDVDYCGIGNEFPTFFLFTYGGIGASETFNVRGTGPLDGELPIETTGSASYDTSSMPDVSWETPEDSCTVTVTAIEIVDDRRRVIGSASCPEPAIAEGQADLTIGDFEFAGEFS